jgi:hypothetical protein
MDWHIYVLIGAKQSKLPNKRTNRGKVDHQQCGEIIEKRFRQKHGGVESIHGNNS